MTISIEILRALISYDHATGKLFWRERSIDVCASIPEMKRWNARFAGKEALSNINYGGYRQGEVMGCALKAHRVAWAIYYGCWPEQLLDHANGVRSDNRISNLREATLADNARNVAISSTNTSGFKGVYWHKNVRKWIARAEYNGLKVHIGCFDDPSEAADAYDNKARELFGKFAKPNRAA